MQRFYRVIAGTIELFVGAYCWTFGSLAIFYFAHMRSPNKALLAGAGALFGALLILRAQRLLGWRRWFFWLFTLPLLIVPIVWYIRPLLVNFLR
jgi:hypothetical protein